METTLVTPLAQLFIPELKEEVKLTRRVLERVPEAQFGWQPHAKSMSLGMLAAHTADLVGGIDYTMRSTEVDFAGDHPFEPVLTTTTAELLARLEANAAAASASLRDASAEDLEQTWTMREGSTVYVQQPRGEVVRHLINHMIHHRGQLMVYLRLLDVPVPSVYGPSADEAYH